MAAEYLRKKKYTVLASGYRCRFGEIDLIVRDKKSLIFVEVKTRRSDKNNLNRPSDAVDEGKRTNLIKFAYAFYKTLPEKFKNKTPRIDVCEVYLVADKKLKVCDFNYIENAVTR